MASAPAPASRRPASRRPASCRPIRRCCRCNGTAKCLRCACVRDGILCSCCLPGDAGNCHNSSSGLPPHGPASLAGPRLSSPPPDSSSQRDPPPVHPARAPSLPDISTILQTHIPTLKHVPKGARNKWASVLSTCLSAVCDEPTDISRWKRVFLASKCLLASPAAGHRLRWREILLLVKSRLNKWLDDDIAGLWADAVSGSRSLSKRAGHAGGSLRNNNIRRAKQAAQDRRYGKAIQALTSGGVAPPSPEVCEEMLKKHPQAAPPTLPTGPVPPPATLSESVVWKGVNSFPKGSAAGPSGLRPSHLREAVRCPAPDNANQLLSSLTRFANLLAAGQAPPTITPLLSGGASSRKMAPQLVYTSIVANPSSTFPSSVSHPIRYYHRKSL